MTVIAIGGLARHALELSGGRARPLPAFPDSPYFDAAGEILWVGARLPAMHPRAVLTDVAQARGRSLVFANLPDKTWYPAPPQPTDRVSLRAAVERVVTALIAAQPPRGFGALLADAAPDFPLDLGEARVRALAQAYADDDPQGVGAASRALFGFGSGLTPAGDDLAGAALFARRWAADDLRWQELATHLAAEIPARTHAVSAALFGDLARGRSFAPLHALMEALARDDDARALEHARLLAGIGHSSGWDMIAGVRIGLTGALA